MTNSLMETEKEDKEENDGQATFNRINLINVDIQKQIDKLETYKIDTELFHFS